ERRGPARRWQLGGGLWGDRRPGGRLAREPAVAVGPAPAGSAGDTLEHRPQRLLLLRLEDAEQLVLSRTYLRGEPVEQLHALGGADDLADPSVVGALLPLDEAGLDEVVEQVRHDRPV